MSNQDQVVLLAYGLLKSMRDGPLHGLTRPERAKIEDVVNLVYEDIALAHEALPECTPEPIREADELRCRCTLVEIDTLTRAVNQAADALRDLDDSQKAHHMTYLLAQLDLEETNCYPDLLVTILHKITQRLVFGSWGE